MDGMKSPRAFARSALGRLLWPVTTRAAGRVIGQDQGLILMFHHVGPPVLPGAEDYLFLSEEVLGEVLDFVRDQLCPLAPMEFLTRLASGALPPRATLLTFDDGTYDQVVRAAPHFAARGLKACFFVCPGLMERGDSVPSLDLATLCQHAAPGRRRLHVSNDPAAVELDIRDPSSRVRAYRLLLPHLLRCPSRQRPEFLASIRSGLGVEPDIRCPYRLATWEELDRLAEAGMCIGNHTLFHSTVGADGIEQFTADVAAAFDGLEQRYPGLPRLFCYPYGRDGDATEATEQGLASLGVPFAFVVGGGLARPQQTGPRSLHREAVAYDVDATRLAVLLACIR